MSEKNIAVTNHYPAAILLMSSVDTLICQKAPSVLRTFTPNNTSPNSILFLLNSDISQD